MYFMLHAFIAFVHVLLQRSTNKSSAFLQLSEPPTNDDTTS